MGLVIPDGYVLSPRGGRPTKHARDIAILLGLKWRQRYHREKRYQAMKWAREHWRLGEDDAEVRKIVRKARTALIEFGFILCGPDGASAFGGRWMWTWRVGSLEAEKCELAPYEETFTWRTPVPLP